MIAPIRFWLTSAGRVRARRRVREHERHVALAHVAPVHAIGGARAALDPAHDLELVAVLRPLDEDRDLGEVARAGRVAVPAKITSSMPPPRSDFGERLAHDPANRLEQVRLAAAIGADDRRSVPARSLQLGGFDEALEAGQAQPRHAHRHARVAAIVMPRSSCRRAPAWRRGGAGGAARVDAIPRAPPGAWAGAAPSHRRPAGGRR